MEHCENCPLRDSPCANSVGPKTARIAVVGRNPGKQEARTGIPFSGPSGQLLDATLEQVGLKREDLYIANAVDCHWPDDEGPPPEAYEACHPRLMRELTEVRPQIILTLGNEGTQAILGKKAGGIMSLVGTMHPFNGAWVIPTYHPAYILRGSLDGFHDFSEAVQRAKALVDGTRPFPEPLPYEHVHYYTVEKEVLHQLSHLRLLGPKTLAIDTETNSVRDPERQILLLQLSDGCDAWVFEARLMLDPQRASYNVFREMLEDTTRTWIFHNAEFDLQQLQAHWGVMPEHIEDSMALALCLSEKLQHCGLKRLVNTYLSVPHYEESLQKYLTHKGLGYSVIPRDVLVPYAGFDAIFTYRLLPILKERVTKEGNYRLYEMLVELQRLFAEMAYFGTKVDLSYVEELRNEYNPLLERLEMEMQAYALGKGFKATEVVANAKDWPFLNVRSPKQLMYFLNMYCNFNTKTTDRSFMEKNEGHEFIDMLSRFRTVDHLISAFLEGIAGEVWPDERVHPDFVHGTVTGRTTIQHPALQTLPSEGFTEQYKVKSIRKLFVPVEGYKLLHADHSQLELRVAWHISGDEGLGEALLSPDMHKVMAGLVYHIPPEEVTAFQRARVKLVTFGMLYGRQAASLAQGMKCTVPEAQAFLDQFAARFPKYFVWWKGQQDSAIETGVLETEFGRRRRWEIITPEIEHSIRNQAANFAIQSTSSDLCISSLIKINKELKAKGWGRALFSVHDSVELEVREDVVEQVSIYVKEVMEHPFEKSCATFRVKVGVGDNLDEASR